MFFCLREFVWTHVNLTHGAREVPARGGVEGHDRENPGNPGSNNILFGSTHAYLSVHRHPKMLKELGESGSPKEPHGRPKPHQDASWILMTNWRSATFLICFNLENRGTCTSGLFDTILQLMEFLQDRIERKRFAQLYKPRASYVLSHQIAKSFQNHDLR